jgi:hypothetical protein
MKYELGVIALVIILVFWFVAATGTDAVDFITNNPVGGVLFAMLIAIVIIIVIFSAMSARGNGP